MSQTLSITIVTNYDYFLAYDFIHINHTRTTDITQ